MSESFRRRSPLTDGRSWRRLSGARNTLQTRLQQALVSQMPLAEMLAVLLRDELDHRHS
jgi:hypothetical protein